jgi:hypothetical protein
MRNLLLGAMTLAFATFAQPLLQPASAETEYPYCATGAWAGGGGCSYTTLAQCRAATSGVGGSCIPNARYTSGASAIARTPRR